MYWTKNQNLIYEENLSQNFLFHKFLSIWNLHKVTQFIHFSNMFLYFMGEDFDIFKKIIKYFTFMFPWECS